MLPFTVTSQLPSLPRRCELTEMRRYFSFTDLFVNINHKFIKTKNLFPNNNPKTKNYSSRNQTSIDSNVS